MEVENDAMLFNQPPNPKRQKREENIDYDEESKVLMTKLKVAREEVLQYLNEWKVLSFEDQVKEGVKFVMDYPIKYVEKERPMLKLMEGVKEEDILTEIKLYEEMISLCYAEHDAFCDKVRKKHDPQWLACMRKLRKIENFRQKISEDPVRRKISSYYIVEVFEKLDDFDGEEEVEIEETTYEDLRNRLDGLVDLHRTCHLVDPLHDVIVNGSFLMYFLENALSFREMIEEGELDPRLWMK